MHGAVPIGVLIMIAAAPSGAFIIGAERVDGLPGKIIAAPAAVDDEEVASAEHMLGFNERQNVVLARPLAVDGGHVPAGTAVSSHMILLNVPSGTGRAFSVTDWSFAEPILGVMSDAEGMLEAQSTPILGAPGTAYPAPYPFRGIEGSDRYEIVAPRTLRVAFYVWQPGDWIRVITAAAPLADRMAPAQPSGAHLPCRAGDSFALSSGAAQ